MSFKNIHMSQTVSQLRIRKEYSINWSSPKLKSNYLSLTLIYNDLFFSDSIAYFIFRKNGEVG